MPLIQAPADSFAPPGPPIQAFGCLQSPSLFREEPAGPSKHESVPKNHGQILDFRVGGVRDLVLKRRWAASWAIWGPTRPRSMIRILRPSLCASWSL